MLTVRQWVLLALGSVVLVSFLTHELFRVEMPRDAKHETWVRFVQERFGGDVQTTWLLLMFVQTMQIMLGIPFLHVTQVCMGLLLPVIPAIASCTLVEVLAVVLYMKIADVSVVPPDAETLQYVVSIARTRAQRLTYTFVLLMSSIPLYISVLAVHMNLAARRDFWRLACLASVVSVLKNIGLGLVLRSNRHPVLAMFLGVLVFFLPVVCTLVVTGAAFLRQTARRGESDKELTGHCAEACTDYTDADILDEQVMPVAPGSPGAVERIERILNSSEETLEQPHAAPDVPSESDGEPDAGSKV